MPISNRSIWPVQPCPLRPMWIISDAISFFPNFLSAYFGPHFHLNHAILFCQEAAWSAFTLSINCLFLCMQFTYSVALISFISSLLFSLQPSWSPSVQPAVESSLSIYLMLTAITCVPLSRVIGYPTGSSLYPIHLRILQCLTIRMVLAYLGSRRPRRLKTHVCSVLPSQLPWL